MGKQLVLVGGGHAHLTVLTKVNEFIAKGHSVTLVSPVTHHYYSGMGPGMLSQIYSPQEVRFHIKKMVEDRGGTFVHARAVGIDPEAGALRLDDGGELKYDAISFNTGSGIPDDNFAQAENVYPVKPIVNLLRAQKAIIDRIKTSTPDILVVGAGPAGIELAGNLHRLVTKNGGRANIKILAGSGVMNHFPEKVQRLTLESFRNRNIQVINSYLEKAQGNQAILPNGEAIKFDFIFPAIGVQPYPIFKGSGLPVGPDEAMSVNPYLASVKYPNIFGGGDCIHFDKNPIDKVGVYAVRENPILFNNLMSSLGSGPMMEFEPQKTYMLIFNLGNDKGIFVRNSWVWGGRLAFILKDYIDRQFMRKFQLSGELNDTSEILE